MSIFELSAFFLVITATLAWVNRRFIGLPASSGLLVMGLFSSLLIVLINLVVPSVHFAKDVAAAILQVDFAQALLNGMLAFLLFAGAINVDFSLLRQRAWVVGALATAGVLLSTVIVGVGLWLVAPMLAFPIPLEWALVFGALISPTDPIAVQGTLKAVAVDPALEIDLSAESLFNDGVGVVVFASLLTYATASKAEPSSKSRMTDSFTVLSRGRQLVRSGEAFAC